MRSGKRSAWKCALKCSSVGRDVDAEPSRKVFYPWYEECLDVFVTTLQIRDVCFTQQTCTPPREASDLCVVAILEAINVVGHRANGSSLSQSLFFSRSPATWLIVFVFEKLQRTRRFLRLKFFGVFW